VFNSTSANSNVVSTVDLVDFTADRGGNDREVLDLVLRTIELGNVDKGGMASSAVGGTPTV
jgi:hypothetical protein